MDEFKSEDKLRPDTSSRRFRRQRKSPTIPQPVSKQHLIIGITILVLMIISIRSAIKSPFHTNSAHRGIGNNDQSNIDLSGSTFSSDANSSSPGARMPVGTDLPNNSELQELSTLQIPQNSTDTVPMTPLNRKQRIQLSENMLDALLQQENNINGVASQINDQGGAMSTSTTQYKAKQKPVVLLSDDCQIAGAPQTSLASTRAAVLSTLSPDSDDTAESSIQFAPASYYTLQLSSASQPATLNAYARKQKLSHYWVYETHRNGRPWYVLVNGIYPSLSKAKNAITQLSANVQANKPWVRQISQVKQDYNK
ncbi:MAG: cell division protein DamX [Sodalis sp. Psp]|nr:cell division protein DamX [Sodalis sp. Psp]MCR3756532.1 cell division protein DamX [Sodalis sp. Ppy]